MTTVIGVPALEPAAEMRWHPRGAAIADEEQSRAVDQRAYPTALIPGIRPIIRPDHLPPVSERPDSRFDELVGPADSPPRPSALHVRRFPSERGMKIPRGIDFPVHAIPAEAAAVMHHIPERQVGFMIPA
jgi:hypothetical protein